MPWIVMMLILLMSLVGCQAVVTEHVDWVIDGDTFIVNDGSRIRISNIDACEIDTQCGTEAKWMLIALIHDEDIILECSGVDVYERRLCEVETMDGLDVGDWLVGAGVAREWRE